MPLDALSANASEIVPVGAIESRWLLRMPCARFAVFSVVRQARGEARRREIALCVEQRERALLLRQLDRGRVGCVAHASRAMRAAMRARLFAVVTQAEHDQRVAQPGEAEADAALGHAPRRLLRQRPDGGVEHVVEHAHRDRRRPRRSASKSKRAFGVNGSRTNGVRLMLPRQQQP